MCGPKLDHSLLFQWLFNFLCYYFYGILPSPKSDFFHGFWFVPLFKLDTSAQLKGVNIALFQASIIGHKKISNHGQITDFSFLKICKPLTNRILVCSKKSAFQWCRSQDTIWSYLHVRKTLYVCQRHPHNWNWKQFFNRGAFNT